MNNIIKVSALAVGMGLALHGSNANAVLTNHVAYSNAVNYCQAFTPGPSNTIRNRVVGAENIGATIAVACNFPFVNNGAGGAATQLRVVTVYFSNGTNTSTPVTCTLLTGSSAGISSGATYAVTKTVSVAASSASSLTWTQADNPIAGSSDLGNLLAGVNCNLPTNMTLSLTTTQWTADTGVGN